MRPAIRLTLNGLLGTPATCPLPNSLIRSGRGWKPWSQLASGSRPAGNAASAVSLIGINAARGRRGTPEARKLIGGAPDAEGSLVKHVRSEGMPQRVAGGALRNPGLLHGPLDRPLDDGLVDVVSPTLAGSLLPIGSRGRQEPLPNPFRSSPGCFSGEGVRQFHPSGAPSSREVASARCPNA